MSGRVHANIAETVGRTPLVELERFAVGSAGDGARRASRLLGKLEVAQPVRQRQGPHRRGDDRGRRAARACSSPGATIIEPTSGNTGIALAFVAAAKGYRLILTMPERMSQRARRAAALPRRRGGAHAGHADARRGRRAPRSCVARSPARSCWSSSTTRPTPRSTAAPPRVEIWEDTGGEVDIFVAGVGTGGTITGVGEVLKRTKPGVHVVAVEPAKAAVLSGERAGNHMIQGIGAGFVPDVLNRQVIDEVIAVSEDDAFASARRLAREEGILAGISCGAALAARARGGQAPGSEGQADRGRCCPTAASAT